MKPLREWIQDEILWNRKTLDGHIESSVDRHYLNGENRALERILQELKAREDIGSERSRTMIGAYVVEIDAVEKFLVFSESPSAAVKLAMNNSEVVKPSGFMDINVHRLCDSSHVLGLADINNEKGIT